MNPHGIAAIAQLGERQTEDLKVPGSIPGHGILDLHEAFLPYSASKMAYTLPKVFPRRDSNPDLVMVSQVF